jgi:glucose dehydrogenase/mono/diheme cytochrome c family protein
MSENQGADDDANGWAAFFGVIATFAVGAAIVLGVGLGILLGYYVIGNGDSSSPSSKTVVAQSSKSGASAPPSSSGKAVDISSAGEIPLAPAFTDEELAAAPTKNWLLNGGSSMGDRYSPLTEISASNVSELKGDWLTALNGSATLDKYSQEAEPVEYDGVIYLATGADDVFAVSGATGKILWEHEAKLPASIATVVCCGWDNRGVAIGNGLVYSSLLDGYVEALNQKTGALVWKTEVASVTQGYTVTMAPTYADGMVFIGPVGAEYGVRGFLAAYNATTGKLVWRHYNVPGPGEAGHDSWPSDSKIWEHGGATTWNTPTYDAKLGLIYYSTANPGEDFEGGERPGDNLYASSIIALNMKTGKMAWYYQTVHHDMWDFDNPSPTVLINVEANGKMEEGIAEASKTGYVYFLNRKTGKPIYPINETPVPQSKAAATAATQPIPTMEPFSPVTITPAQRKVLQEAVKSSAPTGTPVPTVVAGKIYTPWQPSNGKTVASASNTGGGGDNWPPSSFDTANDYYYVCSASSASAGSLAISTTAKKPYKTGEVFTGSNPISPFAASAGADTPGAITAYDMKTGKIVWQVHLKDACYSGVVSTAGGVVFVGRNLGELQAYNATSGKLLWGFQTGAGANAPVAIYESGGKERVILLAGGNAFQGDAHGDNLWQFSLEGTKSPVAAGESLKVVSHGGAGKKAEEEKKMAEEAEEGKKAAKTEAKTGESGAVNAADVTAGKAIFSQSCSVCHGALGTGGNGGPNLNNEPRAKSTKGVIEQLTMPLGAMPSFKEQLSAKEKEEVADYVTKEITHASK